VSADDPIVQQLDAEGFAAALEAAQAGDDAGFTMVYRSTQPALLRYLTVIAGREAADDLAAETWVSALRGLVGFVGDERGFRAWILTIARARWVDTVRARSRQREQLVADVPECGSGDDVSAEVERMITTEEALALIATLPAEQAEIVTLRVVAGLDVADVAELVGKTANHVRVLSHRGLRRLARLVQAGVDESV
jgi:RNA polymerase sigma-70 factor, ECF subfamily